MLKDFVYGAVLPGESLEFGYDYFATASTCFGETAVFAAIGDPFDLTTGGRFDVRVNAIAPGATDTAMSRTGSTVDEWKKHEAVPPLMGGLTTKEEIVGLIRYLLSEAAQYITGQTFFLRTAK